MANKPPIRPYFLGGNARQGFSHCNKKRTTERSPPFLLLTLLSFLPLLHLPGASGLLFTDPGDFAWRRPLKLYKIKFDHIFSIQFHILVYPHTCQMPPKFLTRTAKLHLITAWQSVHLHPLWGESLQGNSFHNTTKKPNLENLLSQTLNAWCPCNSKERPIIVHGHEPKRPLL